MKNVLQRSLVALLLLAAIAGPQFTMTAYGSDESAHVHRAPIDTGAIEVGLQRGDAGPGVQALRQYLDMAGFLASDSANGSFDQDTEQALKHYQRHYHLAATGTVTAETRDLMTMPRYDDLPDIVAGGDAIAGDYVLQGNEWTKTNLTYAYDKYTNDLSQPAQKAAIRAAFDTWSAVTPLVFSEVGSTASADIVISFETGNHGDPCPLNQCVFDGPGGVLAHAFFPPPNGGSYAGDMHFDDHESWSVTIPVPSGKFDLQTVAIHELGHSLGLNHSDVVGSIMFPTYAGAKHNLHADDIAGIQAIYGSNSGGGQTVDAAVVTASASPSTIVKDSGDITVSASVKNNGDATANIPIRVSGPNRWSTTTTRSVAAGASVNVEFSWPASVTGTHSFTVTTSLAGDQNASNNSRTTNSITVTADAPPPPPPPPGDAKLYVTDVSLTATASRSGHSLRATISLGPSGSAASGAQVIGKWIGPDNQQTAASGFANALGQLVVQRATTQTGVHKFEVTGITKSGYTYDQTLNTGNPGQVDVGGSTPPPDVIDASVDQLTASPSSLQVNTGNVTLTATIGNKGSNAATIPVSISGPSGFSDSKDVAVAAGTSAQVTFTWPASVVGNHTFSVSTSLSGDTNAGNNTKTTNVNVTAEPPPPGGATVFVESTQVQKVGTNWHVHVYLGTDGSPIGSGATVTARVDAANGRTAEFSAVSVADGSALLVIPPVGRGAHTLSVTDIAKSGYTYNPALDTGNPVALP